MPSSASAQITSSGQRAMRVSFNSPRKSGSSSAITAFGMFIGDLHYRLRAPAIGALQPQIRVLAVKSFQPLSDGLYCPVLHHCRREPFAAVGDGKPEPALIRNAVDLDRARVLRSIDPIDDGVIDEGQEHHGRYSRVFDICRHANFKREATMQSDAHDIQIRPCQFGFMSQRRASVANLW